VHEINLPAKCVIENLTSLGITHEHKRRAGALLVESVHGGDDGRYALLDGVCIADATTRGLATTRRIADGLGSGAGIGLCDQVDNGARGAESRGHGCLTGTENVDTRARLALLDLGDGIAGGEEGLGGCEDDSVGLHCNESGTEKRVERADKVLGVDVFLRSVLEAQIIQANGEVRSPLYTSRPASVLDGESLLNSERGHEIVEKQAPVTPRQMSLGHIPLPRSASSFFLHMAGMPSAGDGFKLTRARKAPGRKHASKDVVDRVLWAQVGPTRFGQSVVLSSSTSYTPPSSNEPRICGCLQKEKVRSETI